MCWYVSFFPSSLQGDTLENVAKELDCIITTGKYLFLSPDTSTSRTELMLEYSPSHSHQSPPPPHLQPSSLEDQEVPQVRRVISRLNSQNGPETLGVNAERWNGEQISDFVRKLGFLDTEKEGGDTIKHFLHVNEVCGCCEWSRLREWTVCMCTFAPTDCLQTLGALCASEGTGPPTVRSALRK